MKIIYKFSLVLLVVFCSTTGFAQKAQLKKAEKAYDQFAYIDAQEIYLKVVEDGYSSAEIYKKLGNTYYFNSDYTNAAKWYQKLVNEFPGDTEPEYYFRAAQSMKSIEDYKESDRLMDLFASKGGENSIIQNYKNNPDYLSSILNIEDKYVIERAEINSEYSDFGPSFYKDKIVFASASGQGIKGKQKIHDWNKQPYLNLYIADKNEEGILSGSKPLSEEINTKYHESSAVFTKDGKTIYFTRNNYLDGKKGKNKENLLRLKIYRATDLGDNKWTNTIELPFNDDSYSVAHPALSPDGKRLYFSSDMPGTVGQSDLWYVAILEGDQFGAPVNLGASINTEARESFPFISEDNVLYFSTDGRAGLGGFDVYYTKLDENGMPAQIYSLGAPVNSNKDDFGFIIDEQQLGFLSSNREGETGSVGDDIYRVKRICEITINGLVSDEDTGEILPGALITISDENNEVIDSMTVGANATYNFIVDCEKQYTIRGSKENYNPAEKIVKTPDSSSEIEVPILLKSTDPCPPNDLGCRLSLQPIYFDFDRYNIRPDAAIELAKILAAMREYPELIIHIESHTDSRGSDEYNELLSERRAQSTLEWLVDKGIKRNRLSAKGYGESRLVNDCGNEVPCSEEDHQLNRRSMFIIQN